MEVENQNNYGGRHQFADTIINNNCFVNEDDKTLLNLIYDYSKNTLQRETLIELIETIRDEEVKSKKRKKAKQHLKKFIKNNKRYLDEKTKDLLFSIIDLQKVSPKIKQFHYGSGDNIGGDKIINNL